ncbi:MAG: hypothetical protein C4348_01495 [Patescibacteria group bacterium]
MLNLKSIEEYLKYLLILVPISLLIVDGSVLFPYITTKALFFRILVSLALPLVFIPYLLNPENFPKKNLLLISILLFFVSQIVSTIISLNPYRSFWGNAERMEGTWSLFFYLLYFFILFTLFSLNPKNKKIIFYSFLVVSLIINIIQISQFIELGEQRPSSTLGNATYIGFFNLIYIFLSLYFLFGEKDLINKVIILFSIFLAILGLLSSETRGSLLGLLIGSFVFVFYYFLFSNRELKNKIKILGAFFLFLLIFTGLVISPLSQKIPGINRLNETFKQPESFLPRIYAWKIFFDGFKNRPIFGWGQETEPIIFFKFFDPTIYNYEAAIFDRPHNKFIQLLVTSGIFGLITWLSIFIFFLYYVFKNKEFNVYQKASLFGFVFSYLGQQITLFDMQASYLLFFFGLSLVAEKINFVEKEKFIRPYLILFGGISFIFIIIHIQHYYIVYKIITNLRTQDVSQMSQEFLRLSEIAGPFLTEEAIISYDNLKARASKEQIPIQAYIDIFKVVEKAYSRDFYDIRIIYKYTEVLNNRLRIFDQIGDFEQKQKTLKELENIYKEKLSFYPRNYQLRLRYVEDMLSWKILTKEKALKILEEGEKYVENYPIYYLLESEILFQIDMKEKAYEKIKLALDKEVKLKDENQIIFVLDILDKNKDVENLKKLIKLIDEKNLSTKTLEKLEKTKSQLLATSSLENR